MIETGQVDRLIQQLLGVSQWKRLKLIIAGLPHDADREALAKHIRLAIQANLHDFRQK